MKNLILIIIAFLALSCGSKKTIWIDDMNLTTFAQGWGEAQKNKNVAGSDSLKINGIIYPRGVGTHAVSEFAINLKGAGLQFQALVGVDDDADNYYPGGGECEFAIQVDDKEIYSSGILNARDSAKPVDVSIKDGKIMKLIVKNGKNGSHGDHGDWAMAKIIYRGDDAPSPLYEMSAVESYILTPKPDKKPHINKPDIYGARPDHDFLFKIPASGEKPMKYKIKGLPAGLAVNASTGIITGKAAEKGNYKTTVFVSNRVGSDTAELEIVIGDKLALTPPMGWNSWNAFGLKVNEKIIRQVAEAFEKSGLVDYGFSYINIDDGWEAAERAQDGSIQCNDKFPDIKKLADDLHSKGIKIGIYSSPGPQTCGSFIGSYRHEEQDAKTYASWKIDYLKYDWCSYSSIAKDDRSIEALQKPYIVMRKALEKTDRDIIYSLCQYGMGNVWEWGEKVGGNCWRTTGDIVDTWGSVSGILHLQEELAPFGGPGHWNDPDMLVVGMVSWGEELRKSRINENEQYTHITMWCMLNAPLLLGCDPAQIDEFTLSLLTNDEVLAVNQDRLGAQCSIVKKDKNNCTVYSKPMYDGSTVIAIVNFGFVEMDTQVTLKDLKITGNKTQRDLWRKETIGTVTELINAKLAPHACVMYQLK